MLELARYCRVGGPPWWWMHARVIFNGVTQPPEAMWVEVDVREGWGKRVKAREDGMPVLDGNDEFEYEVVHGDFIVYRSGP